MKIDIDFAGDIMEKALRMGAEQAEVYVRTSRNLSIEAKNRVVDAFNSSLSSGYALRVIKNGRLGFSYANDVNDRDVVIHHALASSQHADKDDNLDLPEADDSADIEIFDTALEEIGEKDAIEKTLLLEKSARDNDRRIQKIRTACGTFTSSETAIVNSKHIRKKYRATSCTAQVMAIAEENGDSQVGWGFEGSRFLEDISFERVGISAAERAVQMLGARRIKGSRASVLLDNSVSAAFLGLFAASLSAEAVQKGKSLLGSKLNKQVLNSKLNMVDTGLLPRKLGSRPIDDEGVPQKEKHVVREGILQTYLYNTYAARKQVTQSTGNAVRAGFAALPSIGVSNLFIKALSLDDIIQKSRMPETLRDGLYVFDAMGVHTANPISGEFSVGVTGLWIEKGKIKYPVKEAVISGNILDLFNNIEAVSDDLHFYGSIGAQSLIVSNVNISA